MSNFLEDSPADALRNVLNSHGHGFQYATLKRCLEVEAPVPWRHAVAEYPVTLNGTEIHIDFILGAGTHLLVAECKRTERWQWGFARGYRSSAGLSKRPRADFLEWTRDRSTLVRQAMWFGPYNPPYDVFLELKRHGAGAISDRGAIDRAVSQVMRARSGLIDELGGAGQLRYGGGSVIPVIFTTASLVTTETELATADIETGRLQHLEAAEASWLWLDHNLSRSLRPTRIPVWAPTPSHVPTKSEMLRDSLDRDMTRSIAVVNVGGIESFLKDLRQILDSDRHPVGYGLE